MSQLAGGAFVTSVRPMRGMENATWGGVGVILHNGEVYRIVEPGKRFARGWRAPAIGDLTFVEVNASAIDLKLELIEIRTALDDFVLPRVRVEGSIRFDRQVGLRHLEALVRQFGPTFGTELTAQVTDQVERMARTRLSALSHEELSRMAHAEVLGPIPLPQPVAAGLYQLTSLRVTELALSPHFLAVRDKEAKKKAVRADGEVAVVQAAVVGEVRIVEQQQDALVLETRIQSLAPLAAQLGVPLMVLVNPERWGELEGRQFELATRLLEPQNRGLIARSPELLASIHALLTQAGPAPMPIQRAVPVAATAPIPVDGTHRMITDFASTGASGAGLGERPDLAVGVRGPDGGVVPLTVERKLLSIWTRLGEPAEAVLGLASGVGGSRGVVIAVVTRGPSDTTLREAPGAFARVLRTSEAAVVVMEPGPLQYLVTEWLHRTGGDPRLRARLAVESQDGLESLRIEVGGPGAAATVRRLGAPTEPALAALEDMLPYALIELAISAD